MEFGLYDAVAWSTLCVVWALAVTAGAAITGATDAKLARCIANGLTLMFRPLGAKPIDWAKVDRERGRERTAR